MRTLLCLLGLLPLALSAAPLSQEALAQAAKSAGFQARKVITDVPPAVRPQLPFTAFAYDDADLKTLREKYSLEKVVAGAKTEWEAQLLLKEWLYRKIPGGNPRVNASRALEILDYASRGEKFYCSHYAAAYVECAQALGWQARKVGVDRRHGPESLGSSHHGVAEVWSDDFRKWVIMDSQSNLHFEKAGVPLSAWEIRAEWLKDAGKDVDHVVGVPPNAVKKNPAIVWWDRPGEDETATYFWIYIHDHANGAMEQAASKFIFPQDRSNANLIWYQNDYESGRSVLHTGYRKNLFVPMDRIEDAYWTVCVVEPEITAAADRVIRLKLDSYCPNRTGYQVSFGESKWAPVSDPASVAWSLQKGWNSIRLRTIGQRGVTGPEATALLFLE